MSLTVATEPPFGNLSRQMGKFLDQMNKGYFNFSPGESFSPSVNLYETDTAYVVCVDLSGTEKEKIDVTVEQNVLTLRGHRPVPTCADDGGEDLQNARLRVHLMEIDHGAFSRQVELPRNVVQDKINARYRNGMLWIELPKE
jgi:HSP20 family protein